MPPGGFPCLEVLNLSYNGLDSDAILTLADLPRLRQLDVSRNELTALPADMSGFHSLQVLNFIACSINTGLCLGRSKPCRNLFFRDFGVSQTFQSLLQLLPKFTHLISQCLTGGLGLVHWGSKATTSAAAFRSLARSTTTTAPIALSTFATFATTVAWVAINTGTLLCWLWYEIPATALACHIQ